MTYRLLNSAEVEALADEFRERGTDLPDPRHSFVMGAFKDSGEIAGFIACQAQIHMEPLRLYDPWAYRGLLRAAERELLRQCPAGARYFVTTDGVTSGMAEAMGIKRVPKQLRSKTLSAEAA